MGVLSGEICKLEDILNDGRQQAFSYAAKHATIVRCRDAIPTMQYVVGKHSAAKIGNGFGESLVMSDAHKTWPIELARLSHPMHVKATVYIARPLQYRGGMFQELWKKKGARSAIVSHREIMLDDPDGNVLRSHNRLSIIAVVRSSVTPTAMGSGLNGGRATQHTY